MSAVPTLPPTLAPTAADLTPSTLVLGMGVGTFTIIVLFVILAFTWCASEGCDFGAKAFSRCCSTLVFFVIFISLIFAPRESKYQSTSPIIEVYDDSIPVRISISCVIFFFGILSLMILVKQSHSRVELTTLHHDNLTFWPDE